MPESKPDDLKTKLRKAFYWLKHDLLVFDNIVLIVAAICCLIWTWGAISSMTRNWALAEEVVARQHEKALLELEVETLELENEYYLSAEYQELAARKYQGKMLAGETMIYLPDNSEAAKNKHKDNDPSEATPFSEASNFMQWMTFLFGV